MYRCSLHACFQYKKRCLCHFKYQEGIEEKLERIISLKPDAVHVGVCVKQRTQDGQVVTCKTIAEICERLEVAGLTIVEGTH